MLEKINSIIKENKWLEFELSNGGMNKLLLHGFLDESDEEDLICIEFHDVDFIQCKTHFTYEGQGNFIEEVSGSEAYELNVGYSILSGNKIFKILNTDVEFPMYIISKSIEISKV